MKRRSKERKELDGEVYLGKEADQEPILASGDGVDHRALVYLVEISVFAALYFSTSI